MIAGWGDQRKQEVFMAGYTMTMTELYHRLREIDFKASPKKIGRMIQNGEFPFAKVINTGETGRCSYLIYTAGFEAWAEQMRPKALAEISQ